MGNFKRNSVLRDKLVTAFLTTLVNKPREKKWEWEGGKSLPILFEILQGNLRYINHLNVSARREKVISLSFILFFFGWEVRLDLLIAPSVEKIWLKGLQRTVEGYETCLRAIFSRISKIRTGAWPDMKKKKGTAATRFFFRSRYFAFVTLWIFFKSD